MQFTEFREFGEIFVPRFGTQLAKHLLRVISCPGASSVALPRGVALSMERCRDRTETRVEKQTSTRKVSGSYVRLVELMPWGGGHYRQAAGYIEKPARMTLTLHRGGWEVEATTHNSRSDAGCESSTPHHLHS